MDLVTGSNGFIGSYLKEELENVIGIDINPYEPRRSSVITFNDDIRNIHACVDTKFSQWNTIYHLASVVDVAQSMQCPLETFETNVSGTINLLRYYNFKLFVFASSVCVASPEKSVYAMTKYICEKIVEASGKPYIIFRFANIYGKESKSVIQKFIKNPTIEIYGDGNQTRDFTYIDDLIHHLVNHGKLEKNRTYYIGTGVPTTVNQIAEIISTIQGKEIVYVEERTCDIKFPFIKTDLPCLTKIDDGIKRSLY